MKALVGIAIALAIFRTGESAYHGRPREQTNYDGNNFVDVDIAQGTECPKGFTGQLPYAMDCRQYLNCWKGQHTIQNCAPGTMFNPKSLECDHPSKVKCMRFDEYREQPPLIRASNRIECEAGATGLYPHPTDCAKFLNCHNGGTFIQDCGPGTLFNARIRVCDWPHNTDCTVNRAQGAHGARLQQPAQPSQTYYGEGVLQPRMQPSSAQPRRSSNNNLNSINTNTKHSASVASPGNGHANGAYGRLTQSTPNGDASWQPQNQLDFGAQVETVAQPVYHPNNKLIKCRDNWSGLYPHPFDCYKFLNCHNGATFIQDCGPGTAFNSKLQVCDWPHNVNCSRKSVDFDYDQNFDHDVDATNTLLNQDHGPELSPAPTATQHVIAQPNHGAYPLLSQHIDGDFKKYFYDESQLKQTAQPINTDNGYQKTQSKYNQNKFNGNAHANENNLDEHQSTHATTHNVEQDIIYAATVAVTTTPPPPPPQFGQNSLAVENQYGNQNSHQSNPSVSYGQNTIITTQHSPARPYNSNAGVKAQPPLAKFQKHIVTEDLPEIKNFEADPTGTFNVFDKNAPVSRVELNKVQKKWQPQQHDKELDVKTNLIASDDRFDRNGKSNSHSRFNDFDAPLFATETGYVGECIVPGLMKHPFDCAKFINCESGKAYEQDCAPGTLFNSILKICDFARKVNCSGALPKPQPSLKEAVESNRGIQLPSLNLEPPKFDMNEPSAIAISHGYSKTTKNAPNPTTTYAPTSFHIPDMSVLPLQHNSDAPKYPVESDEDESREPTTPKPQKPQTKTKQIYYSGKGKPSQGADIAPDDIESFVQQIKRPADHAINDRTSVVVSEPTPPRMEIPKAKEHIMPIYNRRKPTSTTTPPPLTIENQYGSPVLQSRFDSSKQFEIKAADKKPQTDYLPLNEALKLLFRPYVGQNATATPMNTQMLEKKILEMADNDTETDQTATAEQSSLAHALFNEIEANRKDDYDYFANYNYDRTHKHDQNCQHYHPPGTFFHSSSSPSPSSPSSSSDAKHSPEFHELLNRKHALSNKEFYLGEHTPQTTPSNVELLPGVDLSQRGYHHPPIQSPPPPLSAPLHHRPHHRHQHRTTTPNTNSLDAPNYDSLPYTTPHQFINDRMLFPGDEQLNQFNCQNGVLVPHNKVCDGRNDCGNRYDEASCQHVGYEIRLSNERGEKHMGRIEVKAFGRWGYVCDDKFNLVDANVVCRELGFKLGAAEVKANSYYPPNVNMSVESMFMMDEVNCTGREPTLRECDFNGWGISDCNAEEVVGIVCKMPTMKCPSNYFLCEKSEQCVPVNFMCDGVDDCPDGADESRRLCNAPIEYRLADGNEFEGRAEVKYRGIWGTVCDDDFGEAEATVFCKSIGFNGPAEIVNERIGYGSGPIWLDQVSCLGNETSLDKCMHFEWSESNCNHTEDISVRCSHVVGGPRKSENLILAQDDNSLNGYDVDTQKYIREIQRNSRSRPDYSNVCGQVRVSDSDLENGADQIGQFRVISGTRTKRGHHPWQATIRARGRNGQSSHWCGAVVLSKNHILTAAHCLIGFPKGAYFIRLGDHHSNVYEDSEIEIFIEDWFIHEDFRKVQHMNNDIALILLKQPIQFTNYIQPICLPNKEAQYTPGRNCTISGWGSIQYGKSTPSLDLKAATVPIISQDVCRQSHIYGDAIQDTMFCAGHLDQSGVDACDGDSGGPLVCADESGTNSLYGIISWGQRCGDSTKPGVYVKVTKYLDWIKAKMNAPASSRRL